MGYQVLARKWRPRFFDEMVGQEHVLRALINSLNNQKLHHAYLFTGTRGVGKTTIARILAKCLNCEQGISSRPCGECSSCTEISEGRFVDLIEVDAASRTRVEDTRELLDNVQYAPTRGRYKVYLIDEVHMLSTHSFNALLKTLEEPPEHVKFLLATTDPQKLPITVLSRCLQFNLKNMPAERIVEYLHTVLQAESVTYEEPALWQLGRAAQGSMRDALSLTDQAIAYGEGQISEDHVHAMLGTMDRGRLFKIVEVMAKGDAAEVISEVASMAEHSPDYDEVLQGLLTIWHKAALAQAVPEAIDNNEGEQQAILDLANAMQPEDLQLYYQIGVSGRTDLALAPSARQGFEMLVLRMLAFRPVSHAPVDLDLTTALQKKKLIEPKSNGSNSSVEAVAEVSAETVSAPEQTPTAAPVAVKAESLDHSVPWLEEEPATVAPTEKKEQKSKFDNELDAEIAAIMSGTDASTEQPAVEATAIDPEADSVKLEVTNQETVTAAAAESSQAIILDELNTHNWWQWVEKLPLAGFTHSIASNLVLAKVENGQYSFDLHPDHSMLFNKTQEFEIEQAIRTFIAGASVIITVQPPSMETPSERQQRITADARILANQALETDTLVQRIVQEFDARIVDSTIRPVG